MTITVSEFIGMALDSTFEFCIYDFSCGKNIFESWNDAEIPEEMENMIIESWNISNGRLELNVDSGNE